MPTLRARPSSFIGPGIAQTLGYGGVAWETLYAKDLKPHAVQCAVASIRFGKSIQTDVRSEMWDARKDAESHIYCLELGLESGFIHC